MDVKLNLTLLILKLCQTPDSSYSVNNNKLLANV